MEGQSICVDHHDSSDPQLSKPETVRGQQSSSKPFLTCGCTCPAPAPSGTLRLVTVAGHLVIEVSEVKRASVEGGQPKTM